MNSLIAGVGIDRVAAANAVSPEKLNALVVPVPALRFNASANDLVRIAA